MNANNDAESMAWQDYLLDDNKGLSVDFDRDHMMPIKIVIFAGAIFMIGAAIYLVLG